MEVIAVASPLLQTRGASPLLLFSVIGYAGSHTLLCEVCEYPSSTIAAVAAAEAICVTHTACFLYFKKLISEPCYQIVKPLAHSSDIHYNLPHITILW